MQRPLHRKLDQLFEAHPEIEVRKNCNVDLALVDRSTGKAKAIFEVKTSGALSAQLYTAFGQLAYYQHRFGNAATKLYLVLPVDTVSEFRAVSSSRRPTLASSLAKLEISRG